jgi:vesicle coat complex subunit
MTAGIDASPLFTEMIMACETPDLVQKKLVYHYLAYYAKYKSDLALLMVNTLSKDFGDRNPLVRGLALRTMTALQIPYLLEHILPRLKQGLLDVSPYVRKTAALGCLKLVPIARDSIVTPPIIERLHVLIDDTDPQVSSNALSALEEMLKDSGGVKMDESRVLALLQRFGSYNTWSQSLVLTLMLKYAPASQEEVIAVLNLLDPLLKSSNASVVLSVSNLFLRFSRNFRDIHLAVYPRLKDPLVTIASGANNETTFVVLSHLLMLAQRQPAVVSDLQRKFYLKASDPSYLKSVKIQLLQAISKVSHILQLQELISELAEYAHDPNPSIAHLAVQAMTRTIYRGVSSTEGKLDTSKVGNVSAKIADQVVQELMILLEINWTCTSDAALVGLKTLLRLHPKYAPEVLPKVIQMVKLNEGRPTLNTVSHAIAEEAYVWLLGEFGDKILETPYILESMVNQWTTMPPRVRLQLLSSTTRIFFARAPEMQAGLLALLDTATGDPNHPDVHDRAMEITRLLAADLKTAEALFRANSSVVTTFSSDLDPVAQDVLFDEFNTLSVLYCEPASAFIKSYELIEEPEDITASLPPSVASSATPPPSAYPDYVMSNPGSYDPASPVSSAAVTRFQTSAPAPVSAPVEVPKPVFIPAPSASTNPEVKLGQLKSVAAMQSKIYETMWRNLPVAIEETLSFTARSQNPKDLEAAFKDFKVHTVASGIKNGAITLFSFAQLDATPAPHVLINISVNLANGKLTFIIKSESADFAAAFHPFFKRVLSEVE